MEDQGNREPQAFKNLNCYLQRIGMFPKNSLEFSTKFTLKASFLMGVIQGPIVFGILCFSYASVKGQVYSDVVPAIYALNYIGILQVCFIIFFGRGQETLNFILDLSSTKYGKPENFYKVMDLIDKLTTLLYWTTLVNGVFFMMINYYRNAYCEAKILLKDPKFVCGLLMPLWLPFEIPIAKLIFFMLSMIALFVLVSETSANILCFGSIQLLLQKIDHLECLWKKIIISGSNPSATKQEIIFCIKYYAEIVDLLHQLNNVIGYIFSPQQNVMVIVMIGILEYQTVTEKNLIALFQLMCWLLVEFVACYSGQILENASNHFAELVYDLDWYEMDPSLRSTFILFHSQVNRTLQFRIEPLIVMNMQYFHKVIKGSYSFVMFLKND